MISLSNAEGERPSGKDRSGQFESSIMARLLVDIEILYLLNFGPKNGYELNKDLESYFNLRLSYGTLYPHLHSLEKSDLVTGTWETEIEGVAPRKKNYSLTQLGRKSLEINVEKLSKISLEMEFMFARIDLGRRQGSYFDNAESALRDAKDFLESLGYSVKLGATIRGSSGREYPLDLYATRQKEEAGESLALRLERELTFGDVLKLAATSEDIRVGNFVVLVPRSVQEETLSLADLYHVLIYEGTTIEHAVSNMRMRFGERAPHQYVVAKNEATK
jgi:DNA-binding PadR family transcriptional regulator